MRNINDIGNTQILSLRIIINGLINARKSICCGCSAISAVAYNVYCGYSNRGHNPLWLSDRECNKPLTALYRKESKSDKLIGGACFIAFVAMVILVGVSL